MKLITDCFQNEAGEWDLARIGWAALNGALFCLNGEEAIRRWQWDRYNRWKGGGGS